MCIWKNLNLFFEDTFFLMEKYPTMNIGIKEATNSEIQTSIILACLDTWEMKKSKFYTICLLNVLEKTILFCAKS